MLPNLFKRAVSALNDLQYRSLQRSRLETFDPVSFQLFGRAAFPPFTYAIREQLELLRVLERAFDVPMDLPSLGLMFGAPSGSKIHLEQRVDDVFDLGRSYIAIRAIAHIEVSGERVFADLYRTIFHPEIDRFTAGRRTCSKAYCRNWVTHVRPTGTGIGTRIFAKQVAEMSKTSIREIICRAARMDSAEPTIDPGFNGYYTWAVLGYQIPLSPALQERANQDGFPAVADTHDLLCLPGGREWWKQNGEAEHGVFSLEEESKSREILREYMRRNGIRVGEWEK